MNLSLHGLHLAAPPSTWRHRLIVLATIVGWLLLVALITSFYVGHSSSPYDVCTSPGGRPVSCALMHRE
jgi:hypothetical protein